MADFEGNGDTIDLLLNSEIYPDIVLTNSCQVFKMDLRPGYNSIFIRAVKQGGTISDPITPKIDLFGSQLLQDEDSGPFQFVMVPGQILGLERIAFPQIGMSKSRFPESVVHMKDAWRGFPPSEYRDAIPLKAPRLLTLDRDNDADIDARRRYNLRSPVPRRCPLKHINPETGVEWRDQRDEFPPAAFLESADPINKNRQAHIQCIKGWDNGGSGSSFGRQFNSYLPRSTSTVRYRIPDGGVIKFFVAP